MANVVVVGANRGIGLELVRQFQQRGDHVASVCRKSTPALVEISSRVIEGIDITSVDSVATLPARLGDDKIDLLVVAAGILERNGLDGIDFEGVERQLDVNAIGALRVATTLLSKLPKGSKIAFLTSRMGSIADNGSGGYYGYRMSKAALNAGARSLSIDLRPRGVSVTILHPGFVRTDMTGGAGDLSAAESAALLIQRMDALTLATTGDFVHANGQALPW